MLAIPEVRSAKPDEANRLVATLTVAFADDPSLRWGMTDADQYMRGMVPYVDAFGGRAALEHGTVYVVGDFLGVAVFLPPDACLDGDALARVAEQHIDEPRRTEVFALLGDMDRHHPREPHWHLTLIGIDPIHRGRGLGSALLDHGLAACDRQGAPAYLEATSPRNVALYRRHGFETVAELAAGTSPALYAMVRRPR